MPYGPEIEIISLRSLPQQEISLISAGSRNDTAGNPATIHAEIFLNDCPVKGDGHTRQNFAAVAQNHYPLCIWCHRVSCLSSGPSQLPDGFQMIRNADNATLSVIATAQQRTVQD